MLDVNARLREIVSQLKTMQRTVAEIDKPALLLLLERAEDEARAQHRPPLLNLDAP